MESAASQIVFHSLDTKITDNLTIVSPFRLAILGGQLPDGMFASFSIHEASDGTVKATVTMQGRSKHGRRYATHYGPDAGSKAQAALIRWAKNVLRKSVNPVRG